MHEVEAAIRDSGVIGIVRSKSAPEAFAAASVMLESGLPAVEISFVTPNALDAIHAAASLGCGYVGAGTVLDERSAIAAVRAGARFLVSPTLDPAVIALGRRYDVVTVPGVGTATEAVRAMEMGATFAKLFPASAFGPRAVSDILAALPQIPLVPTGGVTLDDAVEYIAAGSVAVGLGSALSSGSAADVVDRVRELLRRIAVARLV